MVFRFKNFVAVIISMLIIFVAFIIFAIKVVNYSIPKEYAEYNTDSVSHFVELYRNNFGIPHIVTEGGENDLYFMLGFTQAQDRLWQLDYLRRQALGNTAEIFGKKNIPYDKFIRAFDLKDVADKTFRAMAPEAKAVLRSFTQGVNFYLRRQANKLPFEFDYLAYSPKEWQPTDCIAIFKMYSLKLSAGFRNDLLLGEIADRYGEETANSLIPNYPTDAPHIYESPIPKSVIKDTTANPAPANQAKKLANNSNTGRNDLAEVLVPTSNAVTGFAGVSNAIGSNIWAVNRPKGGHSRAVLACDPHLSLDLPSIWYQAKLTSRNLNLTGMILAGTPLMLIGRNNSISWGIANAMVDDFDYYYEKNAPGQRDRYLSTDSGGTRRFRYKIDTIKVKGETDYLYYRRSTARSGVISDFHLDNSVARKRDNKIKPYNNSKSGVYLDRYCLTYKWSGSRPADFLSPILRISHATSLSAFCIALNRWHAPALNFVYSDRKGNIAITSAGAIPTRNFGCNPNIPAPGWIATSEWTGYVPTSAMPLLKNPAKHFLHAANNAWSHSRSEFISNYWDLPFRAERIDSLLHSDFAYGARDAQLMQNDSYSPQAEKIIHLAIPYITRHYSSLTLTEKRAFERLKKWNFIVTPDRISSAVYNQFYVCLLDKLYRINFGKMYPNILKMQSLASSRLMMALADPSDNLIVKNRNPRARSVESLLLSAYREAITKLSKHFKTNDIRKWKYGEMHSLEIRHPFAENEYLRAAFSLGRVKFGGNASTINNAEFSLDKPFEVVTGASCRFIADMSEKYIYTALPGGISGQNYSPYFSDQYQIWMFGGYVKLPTTAKPSDEFVKVVRIKNPRIII